MFRGKIDQQTVIDAMKLITDIQNVMKLIKITDTKEKQNFH